MIKIGFPLLKRRLLYHKSFQRKRMIFLWEEVLQRFSSKDSYSLVSADHIRNYFKRVGARIKSRKTISTRLRYFLYLVSIANFFSVKEVIRKGRGFKIYKILFFRLKIANKN